MDQLIEFIRDKYKTLDSIPLHAPVFHGHERDYVLDVINSTYVSSVGHYVNQFEADIAKYTQSPYAVVTVNGTSALHIALILAGVKKNDYVLTQALSFVATGNAVLYCQADPVFIDVDTTNLGLSALGVSSWLEEHAYIDDSMLCRHKQNHRIIRACVPMHTLGHPVDLENLMEVCKRWHVNLVEDAAEALGSLYKDQHVGTFGKLGILSFNGNKIITTGGGGMILTDITLGKRAKHLTTTAKQAHAYEFYHDELGFNYRMPNINAALGCAQLEQIELFIKRKRQLALSYQDLFIDSDYKFIQEPPNCRSNYWLNAVVCQDQAARDALLKKTNAVNIMTRPLWQSLNTLPAFNGTLRSDLSNTNWFIERVVSLPSSVVMEN